MEHSNSKSSNIITLTTDFGIDSPYVAEMKGAILSIDASIRIVDGTHSVQPQNILQGALCLRQIADAFPPGTVHVAVVDPGVGTTRRILLVQSVGQYFVAPDNGLLTFWIDQADLVQVVDQASYWRNQVSPTFHGRDIMTPVAAHLCGGVPVSRLSSPTDKPPLRLSIPVPRAVAISENETEFLAEAMTIDSFGNVLINVSMKELRGLENIRIHAGEHVARFHATYGVANHGELICLIGSSGWLELAVNGGNAAKKLQIETGQTLRILGSQGN